MNKTIQKQHQFEQKFASILRISLKNWIFLVYHFELFVRHFHFFFSLFVRHALAQLPIENSFWTKIFSCTKKRSKMNRFNCLILNSVGNNKKFGSANILSHLKKALPFGMKLCWYAGQTKRPQQKIACALSLYNVYKCSYTHFLRFGRIKRWWQHYKYLICIQWF